MQQNRTIRNTRKPCRIFWRWLLVVFICSAAAVQAGRWDWDLDSKRYKQLDMFQRAQYDKAAGLFKKKDYQTAAIEFEKFKVQFPDSPILSYVLFMRARSLHLDKQRNQAIKLYNQVLDFFGGNIQDAAPALYYLGIAHFDNGRIREGMEAMKEMAEDPDYSQHPLAAGAVRRLADNYWKQENPVLAVKYWKQVVSDFSKTNSGEAREARRSVISYYIRQRRCADYVSWLTNKENHDDPGRRQWLANEAYDVAWHGFDYHRGWFDPKARKKERAEAMNAFYEWFKAQKPWYEKKNDIWGFYHRQIQFLTHRFPDADELGKALDETIAYIKKIEKKSDADQKLSWIIDRLREGRQFDRAMYGVGLMSDPAFAAYKEYEIIGHGKGQWKAAVTKLKDIQAMGNKYWADRALGQLAWVYKDRTREYEKAIKTYQEIGKPPGTLWSVQECYYRWGKLPQAITTLNEIENMFPDHGSRAAWQKAQYYRKSDRKKTIAQARRILKMYKKSKEASYAHQLLEDFGVDTGGGVVHDN